MADEEKTGTKSTPEQTLSVLEAQLRCIYTQAHEICELSKNLSNVNTDLFITKARRLDALRDTYSACLLETETLKLSIDPNYKPSMSSRIIELNKVVDQAAMIRDSILEAREVEKNVNNTIANPSNISILSKSKIKLEPIKLPTFDGSPESWTPFHQLFVELVHVNAEYSDLQKVTVLTTHLTGSARSIVTGIPPTAENYSTLFNTLVSRFEDKRALGAYYLDKMMNFKAIPQESEKNLNLFLETFVESAEAIKQLNIGDMFDFVLLHLASKKLDCETMRSFDMSHRNESIPSFSSLVDFVRTQVKIVGRNKKFTAPPSQHSKPLPFAQSKISNTYVVQSSEKPASASIVPQQLGNCGCSESHRQLYRCDQFTRLDPPQRWKVVKARQACINCLSFGHRRAECRSPSKCSVASCGRSHHSLLHRTDGEFGCNGSLQPENKPISQNGPNGSSSSRRTDIKTVACCSTDPNLETTTTAVLLATAIVRIKDREGNFQAVRCLLDPGSESHLISNATCSRLGLEIRPAPIAIKGLGSADVRVSGCAMFKFSPRFEETISYEVSALVVDRLIEALPTTSAEFSNLQHVAHLTLADPDCLNVGQIDLLIGAELWPYIVGQRKVFGPPNTPVGLQSTLGYLLMGRTSASSQVRQRRVFVVNETDPPLDDLLQRFWELDSLPSIDMRSPDDQKCEEIFMDTHTRCEDSRYMVALPFKESPSLLGNSLTSSRARFLSMERRLLQTPEVHAHYDELIKEYLSDGTIVKLTVIDEHEPAFYLPHHGVHKPSSLTTPLRIVFNASARSSSGKSLNDLLYVGAKLQNDVFSILLNMRLFEHVLCTDIRRMFLRIKMTPDHRRFLRFLWRSSPQDPLSVHEFQSLVFGLTCSPFLAQRVIKALCEDEGRKYPLACSVVERDIYIDDITTSVACESQLFDLYHQLTHLFAAGGFTLSKWSSTSKALLAHVPESACHTQNVAFDKDDITKVLGVQWHPLTDVFTCSVAVDDQPPTKRRMASLLARIFDPLGLVSPVTVQFKLVLRDMWEKKLDWDAEPPPELTDQCIELKNALPVLSAFSIPRFSTVTPKAETMLIGFSDASEKAYGGVIYVRTHVPPAAPQIRLLCSRSIISPMKIETIPRLELCAAVLLAKLMRHVINTYQDRHTFDKILAFSDSTVTLHWIRSPPSQWKIFVANRVAKIQENLDPQCWHFVMGTMNPADVLSRGCSPKDLISHSLWLSGPEWLVRDESEWPISEPMDLQNDSLSREVKPQRGIFFATKCSSPLEPMLDRISRYRLLLRATAQVFRFCRSKNRGEPVISYDELCDAERYWVKLIQHRHFANLKICLEEGKPLPDQFKVLDIFLDDDGMIRVGGRIRHAEISIDRKHPILLPKHDRFVNLLIDQFHIDYFHAGAQSLLSYISQKFWIMSAGVRIRSRLRCCHKCFRVDPRERKAKMADLPKMRVQGYKCFAATGVDYAGPFHIAWSRRRGVRTEKAYVCLFVCFAVKAVHVELVSDLSTDNFLSAYKRFLARRGPCAQLFSDCGSNFIGAKRELTELYKLLYSSQFNEKIGNDLAARGVEWKMNPARAPHFGGLWESNIKSMKTHLKKIVGTQILTYEEMNTVLVQIEAIMNSRPLCRRLLSDPTAPAALTPAHFLTLGSSLDHLPSDDVMDVPLNRLSRYQLIDRFVQGFWKRWRNEYLHTLQLRGKWLDVTTPIEIGTVVVLKEDNVLPLRWPLGIIEAVHPGLDKEVRVVTVRTATGTLKRPVVKVCPLPSSE